MMPTSITEPNPLPSIEEFLLGPIRAWGVFETTFGMTRRFFSVDMEGTIDQDGVLELKEQLRFDDGELDCRTWRIRRNQDGSYEGRADDVIGVACGWIEGRVLRWRYSFRLRVGTRRLAARFDDRMYFHSRDVLFNRVVIRKYGIPLGTLTMLYHRERMAMALDVYRVECVDRSLPARETADQGKIERGRQRA